MDSQQEIGKLTSAKLSISESCPICLELITGRVGNPNCCRHKFCFCCIKKWVNSDNTTCPLDRKTITEINISNELNGSIENICYVRKINFGECFYRYFYSVMENSTEEGEYLQDSLVAINDFCKQIQELCTNTDNCIIFYNLNGKQMSLEKVVEEILEAKRKLQQIFPIITGIQQNNHDISAKHLLSATRLFSECSIEAPSTEKLVSILRSDSERTCHTSLNKPLGYWQQSPLLQSEFSTSRSGLISPCPNVFSSNLKRQRGEKKPIPDEQKDDRYFERRRRNNQAAKKSRDARKIREDQVALKATLLEHENAILRAQVLTLREETTTLRQLLMEKKITEF